MIKKRNDKKKQTMFEKKRVRSIGIRTDIITGGLDMYQDNKISSPAREV